MLLQFYMWQLSFYSKKKYYAFYINKTVTIKMNIRKNNNYNINFKTNINILAPSDYNKIANTLFLHNTNFIFDYLILDKNKKSSRPCYRLNSQRTYTEKIRTCTGVVVTNKNKKCANLFGHFYHSNDTYRKLPLIKPFVNGNNAIIVGSKPFAEKSIEIFNTIIKFCQNKNIPTTLIGNLEPKWEIDMAYDGKFDNLFLCIKNIDDDNEYVKNMNELKNVCKKLYISPKDKINFIKENHLKFISIHKKILQLLNNLIKKLK